MALDAEKIRKHLHAIKEASNTVTDAIELAHDYILENRGDDAAEEEAPPARSSKKKGSRKKAAATKPKEKEGPSKDDTIQAALRVIEASDNATVKDILAEAHGGECRNVSGLEKDEWASFIELAEKFIDGLESDDSDDDPAA